MNDFMSARAGLALRTCAFAFAIMLAPLAAADPPARVARLAFEEGAVSFSPAGEDEWVQARINRPIVSGDRLWADAGGRVELQLPNAALRIGAETSVVVANVDDRIAQFQLTQGTVQLRVRALGPGEQFEIDTPNLAFVVAQPGSYVIDVEPDGTSSAVTLRSGQADVYGEGNAYRMTGGRTVRFFGTDLRDTEFYEVGPPDGFERWAQGRDRRFERVASARYVPTGVVGYEDLDAYGSWRTVPDLGNVWFPGNVAADWAPYRDGQWTWIEPWGWTWVDDAPWGFAPFHYGRWARVSDRWCWVPGPAPQRAVYSPALVAWLGGAGLSISASAGPTIGWFPLGPGEVYVPGYTTSRDYFTRINVSNTVVNTAYVTNVYANRERISEQRFRFRDQPAAVTAVPVATLVQAQPVQRAVIPFNAQVINKAEIAPLAKVAPQRQSVTGAGSGAAPAPAATMRRPVVAKVAPPPPAASLESRLPDMHAAPGKPLDRPDAARAAERPAAPAGAAAPAPPNGAAALPQARVVTSTASPAPLPTKPMQPAEARRRDRGDRSAVAPAPGAPGTGPIAPEPSTPRPGQAGTDRGEGRRTPPPETREAPPSPSTGAGETRGSPPVAPPQSQPVPPERGTRRPAAQAVPESRETPRAPAQGAPQPVPPTSSRPAPDAPPPQAPAARDKRDAGSRPPQPPATVGEAQRPPTPSAPPPSGPGAQGREAPRPPPPAAPASNDGTRPPAQAAPQRPPQAKPPRVPPTEAPPRDAEGGSDGDKGDGKGKGKGKGPNKEGGGSDKND